MCILTIVTIHIQKKSYVLVGFFCNHLSEMCTPCKFYWEWWYRPFFIKVNVNFGLIRTGCMKLNINICLNFITSNCFKFLCFVDLTHQSKRSVMHVFILVIFNYFMNSKINGIYSIEWNPRKKRYDKINDMLTNYFLSQKL